VAHVPQDVRTVGLGADSRARRGKKVDEKWKSLQKVPLELYARGNETACREGLSVTAKTVTGRSGDFDFKKLGPGTYWVVARWNDKV
jgi:hypothetical protein